MRYAIALAVACLIILGGVAFCAHTRHLVKAHVRDLLPEKADEGAAEGELMGNEAAIPPGFGVEVPSGLVWRVSLADLFTRFWSVWGILVFATCVAVARLMPKR